MSQRKFFQLVPPNTNIDFIGKFRFFAIFSSITVILSITGMFTKGFNFGIDFTGGSVANVEFAEPTTAEAVRKIVEAAGAPEASVVALGTNNTEYLVTSTSHVDVKGTDTLPQRLIEKAGGPTKLKISQVDIVGPKVGQELKGAALRSLFYSIILIMIYIWLRFDFRFAPGATIAIIHDVIMVAGYYILMQKEFSITAVAALLTIAGYSINDTIVIYDRVREILARGGDQLPLGETINRAINLTLSRTILTSGLTLLSVIPVAIFCEGEIKSFAEAMCFGIFVGSYSTIYIAAPMTIYVQKWMQRHSGGKATRRPTPARIT